MGSRVCRSKQSVASRNGGTWSEVLGVVEFAERRDCSVTNRQATGVHEMVCKMKRSGQSRCTAVPYEVPQNRGETKRASQYWVVAGGKCIACTVCWSCRGRNIAVAQLRVGLFSETKSVAEKRRQPTNIEAEVAAVDSPPSSTQLGRCVAWLINGREPVSTLPPELNCVDEASDASRRTPTPWDPSLQCLPRRARRVHSK